MFFRRKRVKASRVGSVDELTRLAESGRPVLVDFMQAACAPCKVMDGIVDELAEEYHDAAHVVKINVQQVPDAAQAFGVKSTPTFLVLAASSKAQKKASANGTKPAVTQRWRATGLVKKDALRKVLDANGANPGT